MTETVTAAVAQRDTSPGGLVRQYSESFAAVLPSQINAASWVRIAQGALKKGRRVDNNPGGPFELEVAAGNNPGVFLASLLDAARLGLEPGTEQYYLTARKNKGRLEILGIVGYQGHIDLMYRAGGVSSVVAEVVRENDEYEYVPGQVDPRSPARWEGPQKFPFHRFPAFAREKDRGALIGVYAYAHMTGGGVSRTVQLNRDDIERIKESSPGAKWDSSPWVKFESAMWLKSAVRQLQKWVPTSAEYRREMMRTSVEAETAAARIPVPGVQEAVGSYRAGEAVTGEIVDDEDVDPGLDVLEED